MLEALHEQFTKRAGPDSTLSAADLSRVFDIRSSFLAERMLALFDRNGDGLLDRREVLNGVRRLLFGSTSEKLELAFQLHDLDGDGLLNREELMRVIALGLEEEASAREAGDRDEGPASLERAAEKIVADAEVLTELLLDAADRSNDGRVSFEEFGDVVRRHPELLKLISKSEKQWILAPEGLFARPEEQRGRWERFQRFLDNRLRLVVVIAIWAGVNAALFFTAVDAYATSNGWIQLARGCGACLNLNAALVFVPIQRRVVDALRKTPLSRFLPLDDSVLLHRLVGNAVLLFSVVHAGAHLANYALYSKLGVWASLLHTPAGQSGLALLASMLVIWGLSLPVVRRKGHFEVFAFSHFAYLGFAAFALVHGPVFWKWALIPLFAFGLQKLWQKVGVRRTRITALDTLRSGVTRVELEKPPGFTHEPGDYIFIRIPALARFEWHPFTISSAPEAERLSLHVRRLGDWTGALRLLAKERQAKSLDTPLEAHLDGPYGTASGRIFHSRVAILVGAGIGVTPFASVLDSLVRRQKSGQSALEKAYFFWLNRDPYSFEWFAGLLLKLETNDETGKVDIQVYMTGGRCSITAAALNVARDVAAALGRPDLVTGLRTRTHLGQPDWERELRVITERHAPAPVDLFFCGPPGLARKLRASCTAARVSFFQEQF
jgi:predicted ferric reductase/Ca2+-binding EF-hand superfamily protein